MTGTHLMLPSPFIQKEALLTSLSFLHSMSRLVFWSQHSIQAAYEPYNLCFTLTPNVPHLADMLWHLTNMVNTVKGTISIGSLLLVCAPNISCTSISHLANVWHYCTFQTWSSYFHYFFPQQLSFSEYCSSGPWFLKD